MLVNAVSWNDSVIAGYSFRLCLKKMIMKLNPYGNLCTQFYDIDKPAPPPDAFNFYLKECQKAQGSVLELMCGSGRFLIPLREHGIEIDGLDASEEMLAVCRTRAQEKGLKLTIYHQSIEDIALPEMYKLIIIPAASFILIIDKQAAQKALKTIHRHLLPDGKLVLEIETPEAMDNPQGAWTGRWVQRPDGATITFNCLSRYDEKEKVVHQIHKYELFENGCLTTTEMENYAMRFYEQDEFKAMLEDAGFTRIRMTKPFGNTLADADDKTVVFQTYRKR